MKITSLLSKEKNIFDNEVQNHHLHELSGIKAVTSQGIVKN